MRAKKSLKVKLFLLLILLSRDVTGTESTESSADPKPGASSMTLDIYETDTVLALAIVALITVISLLTAYVFLGFWGAFGISNGDGPGEQDSGTFQTAEQERRDREFMETFPILIGIVISCIFVREVIFVCSRELPILGKIPQKQSLRAYAVSVLIHCTPVSVYLVYKLFPSFVNGLNAVVPYLREFCSPAYKIVKIIFFLICFFGEIYGIFFKEYDNEEGYELVILFVCLLPVAIGVIRSMHRLTTPQKDFFLLAMGVMASRVIKEVLRQVGKMTSAGDSFRGFVFGYLLLSFLLASSIALSYESIKMVFFTKEHFSRKLKQVMYLNIVFLSSNMGTELINQHYCFSCLTPLPLERPPFAVQMAQLFCTTIYVIVVLINIMTSRAFQRNFFGSLLFIFIANLVVFGTSFIAGKYIERLLTFAQESFN